MNRPKYLTMITFAAAFAANALAGAAMSARAFAQEAERPMAEAAQTAAMTAEAINAARLDELVLATGDASGPSAAVVRLQILLDRAGTSPGVIDGIDGDNVRKAVIAFETMQGLPADGTVDAELLSLLETEEPVIGRYEITADDEAAVGPPIPEDYAEQAAREFLGYESVAEAVAERFHMDVDLLAALNAGAAFQAGDSVYVAAYGPNLEGQVARIEADKTLRQVRAYDAAGVLLAAYPATIGSTNTPSPSGTHTVEGVAKMPDYTYNPEINFQQGDNTEILRLPPGPNGPVGTIWIDLSQPTYGIHGTPEPSLIDKVSSHGCVRLTNWDAEELAAMVEPGVVVEFVGEGAA